MSRQNLLSQPLLSPQMRLHEPNFTLNSPPAKSQAHIPNGFHARFQSSFDDIPMLSVACRSVPLTAADEQKETDTLESRAESLRRGELSRVAPIRPSCADNSKGAVDELVAREASSEIVQNLSLKQRQTLC